MNSYKIIKSNLRPGYFSGLFEPTATFSIEIKQLRPLSEQSLNDLKSYISQIYKSDNCFGSSIDEWPDCYLLNSVEKNSNHLVNWIAALCIGLQRQSFDPVSQARIISIKNSNIEIALPYYRPNVVQAALNFTLEFILVVGSLNKNQEKINGIIKKINKWINYSQSNGLSPSTLKFALAAKSIDLPITVNPPVLTVGYGRNKRRYFGGLTDFTSTIATHIAKNKFHTLQVLAKAQLPIPKSFLCKTKASVIETANKLGFPLVAKAPNLDQGVGVYPHIQNITDLLSCYEKIIQFSKKGVLLESYIEGDDYRLLVVNGKMKIATKRLPPFVIGDGSSKVSELILKLNLDPRRGFGNRSMMKKVLVDDALIELLNISSLTLDSVIEKDKKIFLSNLANISQGGSAEDVTSIIHPDNIVLAQRAAEAIGLDIAGVDFISKDISKSWLDIGGAIIEVNAQPGFRPHWLGSPDRDIIFEILKESFDEYRSLPKIAFYIGQNVPLIAAMTREIFMQNNDKVGLSSSHGVWVDHDVICRSNPNKFKSAIALLEEKKLDVCLSEIDLRTINDYGFPCGNFDVFVIQYGQVSFIKNCNEETKEIYEDAFKRANEVIMFVEDYIKIKKLRIAIDETKVILLNVGRGNIHQIQHEQNGGKTAMLDFVSGEAWIEFSAGNTAKLLSRMTKINLTNHFVDSKDEIFSKSMLTSAALAWTSNIDQDVIIRAISNCAKMKS